MSGDGVKTDRRAKSFRNKLVTTVNALTGALGTAAAAGQLPSSMTSAILVGGPVLTILLNNLVKK